MARKPTAGIQPSSAGPRAAGAPGTTGSPRFAGDPTDFQKQRLSWHLGRVDYKGPYCFSTIGPDAVTKVIEKLKNFESMSWGEILGKQNHAISVDSLTKTARDRLVALELDDVAEVVSLRLSGKERVFGIRRGAIFCLLWWDPEHAVCPSVLKHT